LAPNGKVEARHSITPWTKSRIVLTFLFAIHLLDAAVPIMWVADYAHTNAGSYVPDFTCADARISSLGKMI
jgi:hypothetical protein